MATAGTTTTTSKVAYLDGIRGAAAFGVYLHHFCLIFFTAFFTFDVKASLVGGLDNRYGHSVFSFLTNGHFFVCIFFVLSGYVLSRKYFHDNKLETLISAAQRRYIRLFVPVGIALILSYVLLKCGLYGNKKVADMTNSQWWFGGMWNGVTYPTRALFESFFFNTMLNGDGRLDTTLWTLSVELMGSYFVFAFLMFTHNTRNRGFSLAMVMLACYATSHFHTLDFLLGIALNYSEKSIDYKKMPFVRRIGVVVMLVVACVLGSMPTTFLFEGTLFERLTFIFGEHNRQFAHPIGGFLLVYAFTLSPGLQKIGSLGIFRFLGRISFSLYVLHPLVFGTATCWIFTHVRSGPAYLQAVTITFIGTTVVLIGISYLYTKYIDDFGIALASKYYNRFCKKAN